MFDFSDLPNWYNPPSYQSEPPVFDFDHERFVFWLYASCDIYSFVSGLPTVQETYVDDENAVLLVVLSVPMPLGIVSAYHAYTGILRSIDAHLNPPLSVEIWGAAIEAAFDEEINF